MPSILNEQQQRELKTFTDPAEFQRVHLKRKLWGVQKEICNAVGKYRHVAVKGCHASGKTHVAMGLPLWWLMRYERGKVLTTAPTLRQVKLHWKEIALARAGGTVAFPEPTTTTLQISPDRFAMGASARLGVNIQALHGDKVLIIVDEAPGVEQDIWDAIEGISAGGDVTLLELGNPTVPSGHFYDNWHRDRAYCHGITISAFDTPNLAGLTTEQLLALPDEELDINPWPLLCRRRWVKERYLRWGPDHPRYMARVLGEFPDQDEYSMYPLQWIERADREPTERELGELKGQEIRWGLDVAGPGDAETTLVCRVAGCVILSRAWEKADPCSEILHELHELRRHQHYKLGRGLVDITGIGYHLARRIAAAGFEVFGFMAGGAPMDSERFANAKAEAYWGMRDRLQADGVICAMGAYQGAAPGSIMDEETKAQFGSIRWHPTPSGKIQIESKDDAEKRGVKSPDRAEAHIMAFTPIVPKHQLVTVAAPSPY